MVFALGEHDANTGLIGVAQHPQVTCSQIALRATCGKESKEPLSMRQCSSY